MTNPTTTTPTSTMTPPKEVQKCTPSTFLGISRPELKHQTGTKPSSQNK